MRKDKKEIRNLLLGKMVLDEDGKLVTPAAGTFRVPQGVVDGAGSVRLFGITGKARRYETELREEDMLEAAAEAMRDMGRALRLREQPDAVACLIRYVMTRPAVLVFRYMEGSPVLTVWTGRGITGWLSRLRAFRSFEQLLSEDIRRSAEEAPKEAKEKKRRGKRAAAPAEEREDGADIPQESEGEDWEDWEESEEAWEESTEETDAAGTEASEAWEEEDTEE